ncbi:MAG: hypothetical protein WAT71_07170 [Ignavibacteria bacterium]
MNEGKDIISIILGVPLFCLAAWLIWQLKRFEGFLDDYDYRDYKKNKKKNK